MWNKYLHQLQTHIATTTSNYYILKKKNLWIIVKIWQISAETKPSNYELTWNPVTRQPSLFQPAAPCRRRLSAASHQSDCGLVVAGQITGSVPPLGIFTELLPGVSALMCFFPLHLNLELFPVGRAAIYTSVREPKHASARQCASFSGKQNLHICLFVLMVTK